jgi:hypothetical protein
MKKLSVTAFLLILSLVPSIRSLAAQPLGAEKLKDAKIEVELNTKEKKKIEEGLREKYRKVAISPEGQFRYPTGRAGLEALKYDPEILRSLPEAVSATYCGVGPIFFRADLSGRDSLRCRLWGGD